MVHIPRWQVVLILLVLLAGAVYAAPNLLSRQSADELPSWAPRDQVSLGLDLQGGASLLLEVEVQTVLDEQLESLADGIRATLRRARLEFSGLQVGQDVVTVQLADVEQAGEARRLIIDENGTDFTVTTDSDGTVTAGLDDQARAVRRTIILEQTIEVLRRRIDELGTKEASIQRQGDERVLVQVPGVEDPEELKTIVGKTAKLNFRFVDEGASVTAERLPPGSELLMVAPEQLRPGLPDRYVVRKRIMVGGDTLVDAQPSFQDGRPVVSFRFDTIGAQRFARATRENVGKLFAIILDDQVISAPVIQSPITQGTGIITGNFSVEEVSTLALLLRAGALPAPLEILEERTVGPGLGADSIAAGKAASVIGLAAVVGFMILAYGLFGLMASVALGLNLVLIFAVLSSLGATLTLPGIAGIVLTIGMAVDANVLIFERIREETRGGRGPVTAIDIGYKRAMTTIVDANLTTLFAALFLFQFGTGPIKGFAVTLAIGLVTSMFTAIMVTRLMVVTWLSQRRPKALSV